MSPTFLRTAGLLIISNSFMTFAWYAHLRNLSDRKWYIAAILSWGIAFFEYMFMVPANRIGSQIFSLVQLKVMQECITLVVFTVIAYLLFGQTLKWNDKKARFTNNDAANAHIAPAYRKGWKL